MCFSFIISLPELTVLENTVLPSMLGVLVLPSVDAMNRAKELLEQFGLSHRLEAQTSRTLGWREAEGCNCSCTCEQPL